MDESVVHGKMMDDFFILGCHTWTQPKLQHLLDLVEKNTRKCNTVQKWLRGCGAARMAGRPKTTIYV